DTIADRISALATLDAAGVACDRARFAGAAESAIRAATLSGGIFQRDGVFVGSVVSARFLRFRHVYLAECTERTFPPVIRQDPLLLDTDRDRLNSSSSGWLPPKHRRQDEERLLFSLANQAA